MRSIIKNGHNKYVMVVKCSTGRRTTCVRMIDDEYVYMDVQSPPVDNKANRDIISYLSYLINIDDDSIRIVRGQTSNIKRICLVKNIDYDGLFSVIRNSII